MESKRVVQGNTKLYAYRMLDMSHNPDNDFDTTGSADNTSSQGMWSRGSTTALTVRQRHQAEAD